MVRRRFRICPFCGSQGMTLSMGGLGGAIYRCSNCDYTGPLVLEGEIEPDTTGETRTLSVRTARINSTLNWAGLLFGLAFSVVGLAILYWPFPISRFSLSGRQFFTDSGLAVLAIGAMLVVVSVLFWLAERPRTRRQAVPL